jgi:glycerol uptake facilitator-like aquaporin
MKADAQDHGLSPAPALSNRAVALEGAGAFVLALMIVAAGILAERHALHDAEFIVPVVAMAGAYSFIALAALFGAEARCLFNPAVAFARVLGGTLPLAAGLTCAAAQIMGAMIGVMAAHFATGTGLVQNASLAQTGPVVWLGEAAATAAFVFAVIFLERRGRYIAAFVATAILFIAAAVTPSLSFANPALTLARGLTESFTSIALADAVIIALIQLAAAGIAVPALRYQRKSDQF